MSKGLQYYAGKSATSLPPVSTLRQLNVMLRSSAPESRMGRNGGQTPQDLDHTDP